MININLFTKDDHENLSKLADLFETAEIAKMFMSGNEFRHGISYEIETNLGDARVTGDMFSNVARKFYQDCRDSRHVHGDFGSAIETAKTIREYIARSESK